MFQPIEKIYVDMDNWQETVDLQTTYTDVDAIKITFLQYTTKTAGHKVLSLRCSELGTTGSIPNYDRSNLKYLVSFPLDLYAPVTCLYTGGVDYDAIYLKPKNLNQLSLQIFIDGEPATGDIDTDHPVTFEIALYRRI